MEHIFDFYLRESLATIPTQTFQRPAYAEHRHLLTAVSRDQLQYDLIASKDDGARDFFFPSAFIYRNM